MKSYFLFFIDQIISRKNNGWEIDYVKEEFSGLDSIMILSIQLTGKHMLNLERSSILLSKKLEEDSVKKLYIDNETIQGTYLAKDLFDTKTGIIFLKLVTKLMKMF